MGALNKVQKKPSAQKVVFKILQEFAKSRNEGLGNKLDYEFIADLERGHFQVIRTGWYAGKFDYLVLFHIEVKPDGKIWVLQNNTEVSLTEEFAKFDIQKSQIVLGFLPKYYREMSEYAVA